jgi:hypothetical protein
MALNNRFARAAILATGVAAGAFGYAPRVEAAFIVTMDEVGSDVVAAGTGSIDLKGLTFEESGSTAGGIAPFVAIVAPGSGSVDVYRGIAGPASFGSGGVSSPASSATGPAVGIVSTAFEFVVPSGYVSGNPLSDGMTFTGATFASLGVTPGTYEWTWGTGVNADSFTLQIGAAVPEPATAMLLGLPLAATLLARRRAKRSLAAA